MVPRDLWKFSPFCHDEIFWDLIFFIHVLPYTDPSLLSVGNDKESPQFWLIKGFFKAWNVLLKWLSSYSELNRRAEVGRLEKRPNDQYIRR